MSAATPETAEQPMSRAKHFAARFVGNANHLAMQFGGPLFLVGSMLHSDAPGDIDLRLMLSREDIMLWFGGDPDMGHPEWNDAQYRRSREELKQSRRLTRRWLTNSKRSDTGLRGMWGGRFDFQFTIVLFGDDGEPISRDLPRLRLDTIPNETFNAGHGDP